MTTVAGRVAHRSVLVLMALAVLAAGFASTASARAPRRPHPSYRVGLDVQPINPCADGTWPATANVDPATCHGGDPVYLGGFGLAGGNVGIGPATMASPIPGRAATGILDSAPYDPTLKNADGAHVRAMAISDGHHPLLVADLEVQGYFVSDKQLGVGLVDMRKKAAKALGINAEQIFIQSDHSHSGADPLGVWGGVPAGFMQYMADQTVKALENAYRSLRPAHLFYGFANGNDLLNNQYSSDPANMSMDPDVRVLQARDDSGAPIMTLLNFSAHADVLGSSNHKLSGDWLQATNALMERDSATFGSQAMTLVGTVGRTQPKRDPTGVCDTKGLSADADSFCHLEVYGQEVVDRAKLALAGATQITGRPVVAAHSYLITDPATNAPILGLQAAGPLGAPLYRSLTPPWMTGNVIGTVTGTARIGDVLLSSIPGEAYPQIALKVQDTVTGIRPGGYMTAGLSNDQLGYLIAPFEAYPQPAERSMLSQPLTQDVIQGCVQSQNVSNCPQPSPVSNDNYFFNVSHTMGERVTCALLRGADDVMHPGQTTFRGSYDRCALFANDAALAPGSDLSVSDAVPQIAIPSP